MIYLASPYSDPNPAVRHERARLATECTLHFMRKGYPIFSPIAYGHPFSIGTELPTDSDYWASLNDPIQKAADELWLLCITGNSKSVGVKRELAISRAINQKVRRVDHDKGVFYPSHHALDASSFLTPPRYVPSRAY